VVFMLVLSAFCNVLGRSGACIKLCLYLNTKYASHALEKSVIKIHCSDETPFHYSREHNLVCC
jgi:hypothetical protein